MSNKYERRIDLKRKRKTAASTLLGQHTTQRGSFLAKKIRIPESSRGVLYSAVYQKDPSSFKSLQLPKSEIPFTTRSKQKPSLRVQTSQSSLPPPNMELLTRQPLFPLSFESAPVTFNPFPESAAKALSRTRQDCKDSNNPLSSNNEFLYTDTKEEVPIVLESPPSLPEPPGSSKIVQHSSHSKAETSIYPQLGRIMNTIAKTENYASKKIEECPGLDDEDICDLSSFSDIEELSHDKSKWSHDENLEDFDRLCEGIDCSVYDEEHVSCPVCGKVLPTGSTYKDLEAHNAICCPVDDIIVLD